MITPKQTKELDCLASKKVLSLHPISFLSNRIATEVHHIFSKKLCQAVRFKRKNLMPINRLEHTHSEKEFAEKVKACFIGRFGQHEWDKLEDESKLLKQPKNFEDIAQDIESWK
jgi:hypothetical protein